MAGKRKAPGAVRKTAEAEDDEEESASDAVSDHAPSTDSSLDMSGEELSSSSGDSEDGSESGNIVNVDFEFFDPKPTDFHGIKALLKVYLDDTNWDLSGFVDLVVAQTTVGSVIKTADEDTPIGVITALNLARYKRCASVKQVQEFLVKHSAGKAGLECFWEEESSPEAGLIVSERLINVPIELVHPLYKGLFDEIAWATEDEPSKELRDSFKFSKYLILTRAFEEVPSKSTAKASQSKNRRKGPTASAHDRELIYVKSEDEIFHDLSFCSFKFPVQADSQAARQYKGMKEWRLVMAVEASQIPTVLSRLKELSESD